VIFKRAEYQVSKFLKLKKSIRKVARLSDEQKLCWQDANFVWQDYTNFLRNLHEKRVQLSARKMLLFSSKWPPWRRLRCERHCSSFSTMYIVTSCIIQLLREFIGANEQWCQDTIFRVKSEPPLLRWIKRGQSSLFTFSRMNRERTAWIWPSPSPPIIALISGMDWSHSWVTSLEEEQPSWTGLSIMWGQNFREFSWRVL